MRGKQNHLRLALISLLSALLFPVTSRAENGATVTDLLMKPNPVVVIDPGHGGKDQGTHTADGLLEKQLVLQMATAVGERLKTLLPVEIVYTRSDDYFVSLEDRTAIANEKRALAFISIHANACDLKNVRGFETYFLSQTATDERARALAEAENAVVETSGPGGGDPLAMILWDMASNETTQESFRLAEAIQDRIAGALKIPNRGVRQAPFHVLIGAQMPSVLIEVGYLTNRREAEQLKDETYRRTLTDAIADAVQSFLMTLPEVQKLVSGPTPKPGNTQP